MEQDNTDTKTVTENPLKWDKKKCKFCNLCIELCPQKGLSFEDGNLKLTKKCLKCKICEKYCPDRGIEIVK